MYSGTDFKLREITPWIVCDREMKECFVTMATHPTLCPHRRSMRCLFWINGPCYNGTVLSTPITHKWYHSASDPLISSWIYSALWCCLRRRYPRRCSTLRSFSWCGAKWFLGEDWPSWNRDLAGENGVKIRVWMSNYIRIKVWSVTTQPYQPQRRFS